MYEENKERNSMKEPPGNTTDDNSVIHQAISDNKTEDNTKMDSISFLDYENYKKSFIKKDNTDTDAEHQHSDQNCSQMTSDHVPVNIPQNQYQNINQNSFHGPYNFVPPNIPQNHCQNINQNPSQGPYNYVPPNAPQNQYQNINQNFSQEPYNHIPPNAPQNQYQNINQNFSQGPYNFVPPNAPQNQYQSINQNCSPGSNIFVPPDVPLNQYQNINQCYPQGPANNIPDNTPYNQYQNGNRNFYQGNNTYGLPNRPSFINSNIPPVQPGFRYPDAMPPQPQYCYPNVPPGRYVPPNHYPPGNPYYSHFQQMPKDYYTLKEIRKSYNRTGLTLLIHSFGIIIIQIFLILVFAISVMKSGTDITNLFTDSDVQASSALVAVLSISFTNIICAVIGLAFTRRLSEFSHIFTKPHMNVKSVIWALLSVYGLQGIIFILHSLYFSLEANPESVTDSALESINPDVILIYFFYSVILAPITEEILFRGMILKNLSVINKKYAIIFSAVLFGLFHENFPQMITATILGILLAYVAVKSNSIIIPVCLHIFNNFSVEVINAIPDSTAKTIILSVIYFGVGTFGIIMFIRSMKNSDTPEDTYRCIYEFEDPFNEKKASFRSALASPAMVIYLVIFTLVIVLDICGTIKA